MSFEKLTTNTNNPEQKKETELERQERLSVGLTAFFEESKFTDLEGKIVRIESVSWPTEDEMETAKGIAKVLANIESTHPHEHMFLESLQKFLEAPLVVDSLEGKENHVEIRRKIIEKTITDHAHGVTKDSHPITQEEKHTFSEFEKMYSHGRIARGPMTAALHMVAELLPDVTFKEDTKELQREQDYWLREADPEDEHDLMRYDSLLNVEKAVISQNQVVYASFAARDVITSISNNAVIPGSI